MNIIRNWKSNLVVLLLIAAITFLFFIGNSLIGRSIQSLRDAYINSLTGDAAVEKIEDVSMNLFGANIAVIDDYFTIPALPRYAAIKEALEKEKNVEAVTGLVSSRAFLDIAGYRSPVLVCGVDADEYFSLFPAIKLLEGRFLTTNESGVMITREKARAIEEQTGTYPQTGAAMLFTAGRGLGFKIRELPLVGIYEYANPGAFAEHITLMDAQTARALAAIQVATSDAVLAENLVTLLNMSNIDDLFDESFKLEEKNEDRADSFLEKEEKEAERGEPVGGEWNFILIKLKKNVSPEFFIAAFNKKIAEYGAIAVNWQTAAGESATMLILIQSLFNAGVALISVVGLIAIINTLSISVLKRRREIGTLRAIGSSDWLIRFLFFGENCALSCLAGAGGIAAGVLFFMAVNKLNMVIPNALIASLLGGSVLHVEFFPKSAILSFILAVGLGFASSAYPVETAVRVEPIAAMRSGDR
jgi:putative ABC transport system permease protein